MRTLKDIYWKTWQMDKEQAELSTGNIYKEQ